MNIKKFAALVLTLSLTLMAGACSKEKPMSLEELKTQSGVMLDVSRNEESFEIYYDGAIEVSFTNDNGSYFGEFTLTDEELYEVYTSAFDYSFEVGSVMLSSIDINSENESSEEISGISEIVDVYLALLNTEDTNPNTLYEAERIGISAAPYGSFDGEEESYEGILFAGDIVTVGGVDFEVNTLTEDMVIFTTSTPLCTVNAADGTINVYDAHEDFYVNRGQSTQMASGDGTDGLIFTVLYN